MYGLTVRKKIYYASYRYKLGITPRHASLYTGDYKHGTQDLRTQGPRVLRAVLHYNSYIVEVQLYTGQSMPMLQAQTHLAMPCLSFPLKALVTADSILNAHKAIETRVWLHR